MYLKTTVARANLYGRMLRPLWSVPTKWDIRDTGNAAKMIFLVGDTLRKAGIPCTTTAYIREDTIDVELSIFPVVEVPK